ncbi:MAG: hypothetical protein IT352_06120 [Gemmatimonadales bacterium]|nr:hypothetical protein [Gemmatimonadales bacterium]
MSFRTPFLAAAAVVLLAGAAAPATLLIFGSSTSTTEVAGGNGTDVVTLGPTGPYQGLVSITWKEDSDIPCWFRVRTRHINLGGTQTHDTNLGGSSCDETSQSERYAGEAPGGYFVNGVSVCRNNQRIKGVHVFYAQVSSSGQVTSGIGDDYDYQENCNQFGAAKYCPTGKVATQIKIYHRSDTPALSNNIKEAATGLALVCRTVEQK